ncbi:MULTISPECIES: hypothetical protein [unclassified Streptomyces]|uniref:hypothetical protein n=1 Tax=unclassified Streptomyces TaxID=2593676 RepID=UPI0033D111B1
MALTALVGVLLFDLLPGRSRLPRPQRLEARMRLRRPVYPNKKYMLLCMTTSPGTACSTTEL